MEDHNTEKRPDILICECNSPEHQIQVYYLEDDCFPECYVYIHLNKKPFLRRLVYGIKYIFGYQSRYGAFDEFILNPKDSNKIEDISKYLKKEAGEKVRGE